VEWTAAERAIILDVFGHIDVNCAGPSALRRCLIVYPWTRRYFGSFGDLGSPAAIKANQKVAAHGVTVMKGLKSALDHLDDIKHALAPLSQLHSETLHVDPDNFRLLAECLTIYLASVLGHKFTVEVQAAVQKFLSVVVAALGRQYH
ncbi:TPA: hemoglobin beta-like protein, partial [Pseudomonas aeruginosa]|nr:hemoglobin beta-like protein [Pseudomonas aeruginosa]HCF9499659.1 hemoglobin beta-like protein [Pseudomonas aeruginosa]